MYIKRSIEPLIKKNLFGGKIIIIYGPRQVGKTTLVKKLLKEIKFPTVFLNCDEADVRNKFLEADTSTKLKQIIGESRLVIIDEAQRIKDIGLKLKLLIDNFPQQQIIATGSSAFELASEIIEPLTGRNLKFWLQPFSLKELNGVWDRWESKRHLESLLLYGSYPAAVTASSLTEKEKLVKLLASDYLYKDVLKFHSLKSAETVQKLLIALALQIGQEVSHTELASLIGVSKQVVSSYIEILEKAFIIFRLLPFSRNLRKELGKLRKIYFFDLGIRNALINNFNLLSRRPDTDVLWENFIITELKKKEYGRGEDNPFYFWRTYDQQEIDLIQEKGGKLFAKEIKWQKPKLVPPKAWREGYPGSVWQTITKDNYLEFLGY